jgi:hypothetical protein
VRTSIVLASFALLAVPGLASAQEARSQDDSYVAIELALGVAGEADVEVDVAGASGSGSVDLDPSFGAALSWMSPLHRYFVLGAQLGVLSWTAENADDRNLLLDLLLVPQVRLPVSDPLELTLSLPLGLLVDFWGGDSVNAQAGGVTVSADIPPAVGFEIGLLFGLRYAVSQDVGLLARVGYVMHYFTHSAEVTAPVVGTVSQDFDISLGQPRLQLGVSF